jgi:hypothetical protein
MVLESERQSGGYATQFVRWRFKCYQIRRGRGAVLAECRDAVFGTLGGKETIRSFYYSQKKKKKKKKKKAALPHKQSPAAERTRGVRGEVYRRK